MLKPPPRDDDGHVIPHDHDQILNDDRLLRGVTEHHIARHKNPQRLASSLYQTSSSGRNPGMSADLESLLLSCGVDITERYQSQKWLGAVAIEVGFLRELGLKVGYAPLPNNPFHCEVWGNITGSISKKIGKNAVWAVPIPFVSLF